LQKKEAALERLRQGRHDSAMRKSRRIATTVVFGLCFALAFILGWGSGATSMNRAVQNVKRENEGLTATLAQNEALIKEMREKLAASEQRNRYLYEMAFVSPRTPKEDPKPYKELYEIALGLLDETTEAYRQREWVKEGCHVPEPAERESSQLDLERHFPRALKGLRALMTPRENADDYMTIMHILDMGMTGMTMGMMEDLAQHPYYNTTLTSEERGAIVQFAHAQGVMHNQIMYAQHSRVLTMTEVVRSLCVTLISGVVTTTMTMWSFVFALGSSMFCNLISLSLLIGFCGGILSLTLRSRRTLTPAAVAPPQTPAVDTS